MTRWRHGCQIVDRNVAPRIHRRQSPRAVNRAIRHLNLAVALAGLAACATVRVFPEANAATPRDAGSLSSAQVAVVEPGDTLYAIAARNGVAMRELAQWNGLASPYTIHAGERLRLSAPTAAADAQCAKSPAPVEPAARTSQASPAAAKPSASAPTSATTAAKPAATATTKTATPATPRTAKWQWPADGVVLAKQTDAGAVAPGIDIVGTAGSLVRAAAEGVVLYSGAGSPGYEELVVLRHADGWVSSYAHNRKRLVAEGQYLKAGTPIAELGRTGTTRDMLHFELRHDGALVDPLKQLPRR